MRSRPPTCEGCPAHPTAQGFVPGEGNPHTTIALVGQGPGTEERDSGHPWVGRAGQKLERWCHKAGIQWKDVWRTNVVQCHLPGDRKPTAEERAHCWRTLVGPELAKLSELRLVVPVGVPSMEQFCTEAGEKMAGVVGQTNLGLVTDPTWTIPVLHPAYILRGQFPLESAQVVYLRRAKELADHGRLRAAGWCEVQTTPTPKEGGGPVLPARSGRPYRPDSERPTQATLLPTLQDLVDFRADGALRGGVVIDIETAGPYLVCVGLLRLSDLRGLVVPIRTQGGSLYWQSWEDFLAVVAWLGEVLADEALPKVWHGGVGFDIPYLTECGFIVRGNSADTLLMQQSAYPEQPKRLEWLAVLYAGMPRWKHLSHDTEEEK